MHTLEKDSITQFDLWARYRQFFSPFFLLNNRKVVKILNPKMGSSLLDVGCGWGILLEQMSLLERNLHLFGVDISPQMVAVAQSKCSKNKGAEIKEGSADNLPYKDNSFDSITCLLSFHHHPDSLRSLKEMFRVIKPGGRLYLQDPFMGGIITKIMMTLNNFLFQEKDIHVFTKQEMHALFKQAGYQNIKQQTLNAYHLLTVGEKISSAGEGHLP